MSVEFIPKAKIAIKPPTLQAILAFLAQAPKAPQYKTFCFFCPDVILINKLLSSIRLALHLSFLNDLRI